MKLFKQFLLGLSLILLSAIFYLIHYAIFKDANHILNYILIDIAFVPIEVLLVTLVIHRLLSNREKQAMLNKLNMIIGAFYSELGQNLLQSFAVFDVNAKTLREDLIVTPDWFEKDFVRSKKKLQNYNYCIDSQIGDLEELRSFLLGKREFLLTLLQNPNLLEHESFTELLWAVFHLTEELEHRKSVSDLSTTDNEHLSGDIRRAYVLLIIEWLAYLKHLKNEYPYLFSLAIRTNPFDPNAKAEII